MILVSPHLDDAVLSCGQLLAATPGAVIVTVFAGVPESDLPVTDYDVRSGFGSARHAVESRHAEDRRACAVLDATPVHLQFLDRQYAQPADPADIVGALTSVLAELEDPDVLIPVGLEHPDHQVAARCARQAAVELGLVITSYEELPARVLWPEQVPGAVCAAGCAARVNRVAGPLQLKEAAVACYRSQAWALDRHAVLVPERYWS